MSHISPVLWQFLVKWLTNFPLFPPEASKIAPQMDALYFFMVLVSLIGLTIVILLVVGFSILYSKKRHPVAVQIEGSTLLEATWTIIPLGLFLIMFVWGALIYFRVYTPPANAMNIYVVGKQWMWKAEHPGGQHEIDALHVPTGRAVQLTIISQDVFHSFSIPAFRVKREAIPGRYTSVWFEATTPGTYHLFCTQYCGTDHSHMIGDVVVMTPDDFKKWLAGSTSGASLAQNGERLFASLSCNACHNTRPDARGPSLANVYGSKLTLANGQNDHRRRSISARGDPESLAAHHAGLRTHHAHLPGADQRRRRHRAGRIHQESQLRLPRSADTAHDQLCCRRAKARQRPRTKAALGKGVVKQ